MIALFDVLFIYCLFVCLFAGEWLLDEEQLNFQDQDFDFPLSEDQGKCPLIILNLYFLSVVRIAC